MTRELSRASLATAAEATVTALAISGDPAAYGELVRRRQAQMRGLFRRLCRDAVLADDLAQQTFLHAWRRLGTLRTPAAFGGWLRKIAISIWLQHVRANAAPAAARGLSSFRDLAEAHKRQDAPEAIHEAAHEPTLGERLDLDRALSELSPTVRLCVVLAYGEGLTHREISDATELPLGTVKSHIARGAARLRDLLGAYA